MYQDTADTWKQVLEPIPEHAAVLGDTAGASSGTSTTAATETKSTTLSGVDSFMSLVSAGPAEDKPPLAAFEVCRHFVQ